jgi:EAL domain-containing protein (putative c-di-GMP-specific phosphodiesterase class I)
MKNAFHFPYHNAACYWLCALLPQEEIAPPLLAALSGFGLAKLPGQERIHMLRTQKPWPESWAALKALLARHQALSALEFAVIAGEAQPTADNILADRKSAEALDDLAENLWLADAIAQERLLCYMQPIIDRRGKTFGYEAFVRLQDETGQVIGGGRIIEASRKLHIERLLDRQLHALAVQSFVDGGLEGYLFVNFVPGFIMRPEKYLEGLAEAAQETGMPPKNIVLDVTHAELAHDALHLKSVFDYCRSKGYAIALDDINSLQTATRLLDAMRPDFLKLDMGLVKNAMQPNDAQIIRELITLAHEKGCMAIAEGVENESIHQALLDGGADLFQGYHFSAPFDAGKARRQLAS